MELITYFEKWIVQLAISIRINKDKIGQNPKLREHIHECLEVCRIVDHATKAHFDM